MSELTGKTILIVDDDKEIRLMLKTFLQQKGFLILEARDGIEAIEVAQRERPDLIMMDLHLPKLNGFDAARRIRQHPELHNIPILTNSADGMMGIDYTLRSHELGAGRTEYFTKPIDFEELEDLLYRFLHAN